MEHETPAVTVTARTDSRWRCGVEHGTAPVAYEAGHWSDEELELLRADPMLLVVDVDGTASSTTAERLLSDLDRDWLDRLAAVHTHLKAEQVDRLVDLESDGVAALLNPPPAKPALEAAIDVLQTASAEEVRQFLERLEQDPEIRPKIEAAVAAGEPPAPEPDPEPDSDPEPTRGERILAAVATLDPENPDHWNRDGETPSIAALEAATGLDDIKAVERDAAHREHAEAQAEE